MRHRLTTALLTALVLVIAGSTAAQADPPRYAPDAPTGLTVNDDTAPLNVGAPAFAWLPQDRDPGETQSAYQLVVRRTDRGRVVWDSGRVRSSEQTSVPYGGEPLEPGTAYSWTVRTWDRTGSVSPWAQPGRFETGLGDGDWEGAAWIRRDTSEADDYTLARTEVAVTSSPVVRARAYTAANHTYELYLNGVRADRGTSFGYPGEGFYQAADVTDLVRAGRPLAIGVLYHWYSGGQGRPAAERGLLHKLVIEHRDGTRQVVTTGADWRVTRDTRFVAGAGRRNSEGDRIDQQDGRGVIAGWKEPGFDAGAWPTATVIGTSPHLTGQETRLVESTAHPVAIRRAEDGTQVVDFGRVIPARPVVRFASGQAGRAVTMRAGYILTATGRVDASTLQSQGTNMTFPYVQKDGPQEYQAFTHLGFRYLEIPGAGEELDLRDVSAVVVHTAVPEGREASFRSSDKTLNQVWDLMQRSALYSVQEHFVDTPTREKGQFLGDAANISYATMQGFAERTATRQAIREFLQSQKRYWTTGEDSGRYNAVYPNGDGKRDIPDYTEMFVDWVWRYYEVTGDRALLVEAYPAIKATAEYVRRHIPATGPTAGLVTNLTGGSGAYRYGIVDWPAPGRFGYDMTAAARTTINALAVEVLRRTADMGEVLGEPTATYRTAEETLVGKMNQLLRRPDGVYVDGLLADGTQSGHAGQHSTSYAIAYGIAPAEDYPRLAAYLTGMGMRQGPMTAHWLLNALSDRPDAVLKLLTNPADLGWANILDQGATFTWEAWTLDPGTNFSQSHGWGAQAAVDVIETMLGIRLGSPGGATVSIVLPATGLQHAAGTVHTQRGSVSLDWRRTADGLRATVDVPVNVVAQVALPAGTRYLAPGARYIGAQGNRLLFEIGSGQTTFVPRQG